MAIVVGGGFSGAMVAAHLAARGVATTVVEPGELGRGLAYGPAAARDGLLLNTPACFMSALPDDAEHFARWHGGDRTGFAPRGAYGAYVGETVAAMAGDRLVHVRARAIGVERRDGAFEVACDDGSRHAGGALVLALGNAPPRALPGVDPARDALDVGAGEDVLVVGTGLTAIDAIVALRGRGHRGRITAVSRRGLVPMGYDAIVQPVPVPAELVARPSLHGLLAWWRSAGRGKSGDGAARAAGLRLATPAIWRALSLEERAAFVRHLRPRLDVVRHRAPPQLRALVDRGLADGWLEVIAGRLVELRPGACTIAAPGGAITRTFASLVNATGPERDLARTGPLVRSLVERGWVVPDPLGLGAVTGPRGELAEPGAFAVGPWRVGQVWESTTVPELRGQAADTAAAIT